MSIDKKYVGGAVQTSIVGSMTPTVPGAGQTFSVSDATGYPASGRFVVKINRGESDEEKILCASRSGTTFTVELRGYDDTTAQSHSGATCELTVDAAAIQALVDHADDVEADPHSTKLLNNTRHDVTARHTFGAALGSPGTPEAVVADQAGSAGVGSVPARSDHAHAGPVSGLPVAVGTALSAGSGTAIALANHVHEMGVGSIDDSNFIAAGVVDTDALATDAVTTAKILNDAVTPAKTTAAKGIIARQSLSTVSSAFASGTNSDFVLSSVTVSDSRLYKVTLKTQIIPSALSQWNVYLRTSEGGGLGIDRFWRWPTDASQAFTIATSVLWEPSSGTHDLRVRQTLASGAGTLQYAANADIDDDVARRVFWVEDIGPR